MTHLQAHCRLGTADIERERGRIDYTYTLNVLYHMFVQKRDGVENMRCRDPNRKRRVKLAIIRDSEHRTVTSNVFQIQSGEDIHLGVRLEAFGT